jgi:hypothetical protein
MVVVSFSDGGDRLVPSLVLHPTSTSQWHELVREAAHSAEHRLDEELESYLVFLLMRFATNRGMASRVLAIDYLQGQLERGRIRQEKLRDVGDHCLLFSGLFPKLATRRRVRLSYFIDLGRGAYHQLSDELTHSLAETFASLSESFVDLMDVLQAMRRMGREDLALQPIEAFELWSATGSRAAFKAINKGVGAFPVRPDSDEIN